MFYEAYPMLIKMLIKIKPETPLEGDMLSVMMIASRRCTSCERIRLDKAQTFMTVTRKSYTYEV
jgi:hypothetical protein